MKSRILVCFFLLFFISLSGLSCKQEIEKSDLSKTYSASQLVHGKSQIDVVFQSLIAAPDITLPTSIQSVQQFPFSYLNKEGNPMKIVKITRDGNTLDLLIDKPDNRSAFLIEKPSDFSVIPAGTNAVYQVERSSGKLSPVNKDMNIAMVTFSLTNTARKRIAFESVEMMLQDSDGSTYSFDQYLSESLMTCDYPEFLKKNETHNLRYLCLLPNDLSTVTILLDGVTYEWELIAQVK